MELELALTTAAVFGALFSLVCRIGHMRMGETQIRVFLQHLMLAAGLVFSLAVPASLSALPIAIGVSLFLTLGSVRWRHGAPDDTRKRELL